MTEKENKMISAMGSTGLVPLFSHDETRVAQHIFEACYLGGVRVIEFTNRKKNAQEVFSHLIRHRESSPEMLLGIGTVMDELTTKKFIDAGADFIVSPILNPAMAKPCRENNIPWIPGCATLTEIVQARDLGAAVIKVFPGSVLGPNFISSILPVVPDLKLMITGGVEATEENLAAWFKAGSLCVGLGSNLFSNEIIKANAWDKLQSKVSDVLTMIRKIKSTLNPHSL
jgi:2-dehydro-3-deoxyphosphogluconate aldolase / (4S)-4-hydroxy-2-oxoglutarate aldolase